eukprot:scaffold347_cov239-Pinguiococcus_pyrenoidosus.AAC.31
MAVHVGWDRMYCSHDDNDDKDEEEEQKPAPTDDVKPWKRTCVAEEFADTTAPSFPTLRAFLAEGSLDPARRGVPINSRRSIAFETDTFEGHFLVLIRQADTDPAYDHLFAGRNRMMHIQVMRKAREKLEEQSVTRDVAHHWDLAGAGQVQERTHRDRLRGRRDYGGDATWAGRERLREDRLGIHLALGERDALVFRDG